MHVTCELALRRLWASLGGGATYYMKPEADETLIVINVLTLQMVAFFSLIQGLFYLDNHRKESERKNLINNEDVPVDSSQQIDGIISQTNQGYQTQKSPL